MSIKHKAAREGAWLAAYRFLTQGLTWGITIYVARLLNPEDYGLMAMAAFLTAYIETFSELGLGGAIIQRDEVTQEDLSSIFWFSVMVGAFFAALCFVLAYPTAWIFKEPRVMEVTRLISLLFVIGSLMIVPNNLLVRRCEFKAVGETNFVAALISSLATLAMARAGYGVLSLIGGVIVLRGVRVALTWRRARWRPDFRFSFARTRPYLGFGINIAISGSMNTMASSLDKFIVGRIFNAGQLGLYSYAQSLASIPTDKLTSIIQQVSFPVFSRYQRDSAEFRAIYLKVLQYVTVMIAPVFFGGIVFGTQIIQVVLGEKWMPIVPMFKLMCVGQFVLSVTTMNNSIHNSQGRSSWGMYFTLLSSAVMLGSVYVAARAGFEYLALPWATAYPALCVAWALITVRKIGVPITAYLGTVVRALGATVFMIAGIKAFLFVLERLPLATASAPVLLMQQVLVGVVLYGAFLVVFEAGLCADLARLWRQSRGPAV